MEIVEVPYQNGTMTAKVKNVNLSIMEVVMVMEIDLIGNVIANANAINPERDLQVSEGLTMYDFLNSTDIFVNPSILYQKGTLKHTSS